MSKATCYQRKTYGLCCTSDCSIEAQQLQNLHHTSDLNSNVLAESTSLLSMLVSSGLNNAFVALLDNLQVLSPFREAAEVHVYVTSESPHKVPLNTVVKEKHSRRKRCRFQEAHSGTPTCGDQHLIDHVPMRMLMALHMQSETQNNHPARSTKSQTPTTTTHHPDSYTQTQHSIQQCHTSHRIKSEGAKVVILLGRATRPSCIGPLGNKWRRGMPYQRPLDVLEEWVALDVFCTSL